MLLLPKSLRQGFHLTDLSLLGFFQSRLACVFFPITAILMLYPRSGTRLVEKVARCREAQI